ncbi:MAG TPA: hydantoinase/oxoprolinase family protein [Tissierellaceae bacterium]|nr:hydantoinase/oxoprolinase family protein [Tissierellaceae bacterium]
MIVGIDMGGTNIDGVIIEDGRIIKSIKKATDRENLFDTIYSTLKELLADHDKSKIERINLSTTVSTNAIVEKKTTPVGMIIQAGPGMSYDNLACGQENAFISGYIDHRGNVVEELDGSEIEDIRKRFKKKGIKSVAVVTKFSTRNPQHEIEINRILGEDLSPVTMGHTMSGKLNFPRRVYTSYLNSAVDSTFYDFARNIKKSLEEEGINAPPFILKADGGTMTIDSAEEKPVETILSGPAASFMGINALLPTDKDAVLLDIGGTTTDIFFLADGVPLFEPLGIKIGEYKTLVRSIYSISIGLGGDSSIDLIDETIKIGPQREGRPYALGGPKPTPTDAMIALGLISYGHEYKEKANESMDELGKKLDLSADETARFLLETMANMIKDNIDRLLNKINSQPVYTIKELLYGKRIEPKLINIIGGPAKVLAPILENEMDLPCHYPDSYLVANAVGAALARPTMEITMHVDTSKQTLSVPELELYEKVSPRFSLDMTKKRAIDLVRENVRSIGTSPDDIDAEITEESSFNMVRGFYTSGKDIRVKAQIKPGLIQELRGDDNA